MNRLPQSSFEDARAGWREITSQQDWPKLTGHIDGKPTELVRLRAKHGTTIEQVLKQWGIANGFARILEKHMDALRDHAVEVERAEESQQGYDTDGLRLAHDILGERAKDIKGDVCGQFQERLGLKDGPDLRGRLVGAIKTQNGSATALFRKGNFTITSQLESHLAALGDRVSYLRSWAEILLWLSLHPVVEPAPPPPAPPKPPVPPPPPVEHHSEEEDSGHETLFDPPPVVPQEELAYAKFMAVLSGGGRIEVDFERAWLVWRYGILASPDYTRKGVGIKRCVQLSRKLHNGDGADFLEVRGVKDEHVLKLVAIFKEVLEVFGYALDYRAMHRMLRAHPPSWEEIQAKLAGTDPEFETVQALMDFCQRFDTVGKALRSLGVVNGHIINHTKYYLLTQGVDCVPDEEIPTEKVTVKLAVPLPLPTPPPAPAPPVSQLPVQPVVAASVGMSHADQQEKTRRAISVLDVHAVIGSLSHAVRSVLRRDPAACQQIIDEGPRSSDPHLRWAAAILLETQRMANSRSYTKIPRGQGSEA